MFQDFAKKKFEDYLALLEFPAGRISFDNVRTSTLPPFIINFIEFYLGDKNTPIDKKDFEAILQKSIIFNINYIVRPKNTILKFLFGEIETRHVDFIMNRLRYFQFYGYYITQITDFINVNSLEMVSSEQIEYLINGVNKKIKEEISLSGNDNNRLNLVKLPYYFFHDLDENNPINIKLPKKILVVFFQDKGFSDIKTRVDNFFSDEIFIQEAVELMNPETKKSPKAKSNVEVSDEKLKEIVSKVKTPITIVETKEEEIPIEIVKNKSEENITEEIVTEEAASNVVTKDDFIPEEEAKSLPVFVEKSMVNKQQEQIEQPDIQEPRIELPNEEIEKLRITVIDEKEAKLPKIEGNKIIIDEDIYSDDLMFASQFNDIAPPKLTEEEQRAKLINDLFCEETYRRKIIKIVFHKNENLFRDSVASILNESSWEAATPLIEKIFNKEKVDYYNEAAIKFVDIMQSHFAGAHSSNSKAS